MSPDEEHVHLLGHKLGDGAIPLAQRQHPEARVSQVCVDAAEWETDAVKEARAAVAAGGEHAASHCLGNATTQECYELGLSHGRGCSFALSDGCSPAAALRLSGAALAIMAMVTVRVSVDALWV